MFNREIVLPRTNGQMWRPVTSFSGHLLLACLFVGVQSLSRVWLFATPWAAAHQASLSFTTSQSSLTLMSLSQWCHPTTSSSATHFSFPSIRVFPSESTPRLRRERRTCMKHLDILQIPSGFKPSLPKLTSSTFLCSRPTRNIAKPGSSSKSAIVAATHSVSECP